VDEAGRATQPPLIMAPPSLKVDPDGEAADAIVDNGIMSAPRAKAAWSRPEASRQAEGANGDSSPAGDTATSEDSEDTATSGDAATTADTVDTVDTADWKTTKAASSTEVPLPAETIGKAKGRAPGLSGSTGDNGRGSEPQGGRQAMGSGDSVWLTSQKAAASSKAEDSVDAMTTAAVEAAAESSAPAAKDDYKSVFTPTASASTAAASPTATSPAAPAPSAARTGTGSPYSGSSSSSYPGSRPGTGSSYQATAYAPPAGYPGQTPPEGVGAPRPRNGSSPSNGFSTGTASAAAGAAAGRLASSVTSAFQRRGTAKGFQTRKSTKRQAMLTLARVEPWSVMKFSFVASVVAFVILFVAVAVLYMVLAALGVFDSLQNTVSSITSSQSSSGTNISHWFSASLILGYTAMLGALNIVLITAMSTVGSVVYNLIAKTIGGIEVTLRETD